VEKSSERIYQIMVRRGIVIPEYDEVIEDTKNENAVESNDPKTEDVSAVNRLDINTMFKQ
jgi:hypothetical protein